MRKRTANNMEYTEWLLADRPLPISWPRALRLPYDGKISCLRDCVAWQYSLFLELFDDSVIPRFSGLGDCFLHMVVSPIC